MCGVTSMSVVVPARRNVPEATTMLEIIVNRI